MDLSMVWSMDWWIDQSINP